MPVGAANGPLVLLTRAMKAAGWPLTSVEGVMITLVLVLSFVTTCGLAESLAWLPANVPSPL